MKTQRGAAETSSGNTFPQSTIILGSKYITHKDLLQAEKKKNSNFAKKTPHFRRISTNPRIFSAQTAQQKQLTQNNTKNSKFHINLIFSRHKMSLCARYIIQARYILCFKTHCSLHREIEHEQKTSHFS